MTRADLTWNNLYFKGQAHVGNFELSWSPARELSRQNDRLWSEKKKNVLAQIQLHKVGTPQYNESVV